MNNKIICLSYNISWATQANMVKGSEWDFVKACQKKYGVEKGGKICIDNALKELFKLDYNFDVVALQECNSDDIESRFMNLYPYTLTNTVRTKSGLESSSILWNEKKLGKLVREYSLNLGIYDDRSCTCILLKKYSVYTILITLHGPNPYNNEQFSKSELLNLFKHDLKEYLVLPSTRVIILGDFNDEHATISDTNKLVFKLDSKNKLTLTSGFNREYHLNNLMTCCWHANNPNHHFTRAGDVIIANENCRIDKQFIPDAFNLDNPNEILYSDHKPVVAFITLLNSHNNNTSNHKTSKTVSKHKLHKLKSYNANNNRTKRRPRMKNNATKRKPNTKNNGQQPLSNTKKNQKHNY